MRKFLFFLSAISFQVTTVVAQDLDSTSEHVPVAELVFPTFLMNGPDLNTVIAANAKSFHDGWESRRPMFTTFKVYNTYDLKGKDERRVRKLVKDFCEASGVPFSKVTIDFPEYVTPYTIPKTPIVNKKTLVSEEYIETLTSEESKAKAKEYTLVVKVSYTWVDF